MTDQRLNMTDIVYKNPPITEAVIGIYFKFPLSEEELSSFNQKLSRLYQNQQVMPNVNVALEINENTINNPIITQVNSYRLSRDNSTQIILLSKEAFVLSQLAPYKGWDDLYQRFTEAWAIKTRAVGFQEIGRVGVRYINRIDIPIENDNIEYENYLNIYPAAPKSLGNLNAYAIQVALPIQKIGCNLNINSAVVSSPIIGHLSFVLDLDIFKLSDVPQSDKDLCSLLNEIHVEKNRVFEDCITDNARKLFNHEQ